MRSLKVLILEHNPFQLMSLHQMLNAIGIYDVLTAPSLASALCSLNHRGSVDLAIFDPHHASGDGLLLIRHLATHDRARALILLGAVSLSTELDDLLLKHELPLQGRLHTPVSPVLLRGLVDKYLSTHSATCQCLKRCDVFLSCLPRML